MPEQLKRDYTAVLEAADRRLFGAVNHGDITVEEFKALAGRSISAFAEEAYRKRMERAQTTAAQSIGRLVELGRLTAEDYQRITGSVYTPGKEDTT